MSDYNGANLTDPYNASTGSNRGHALNSVDITNLDVIGYDAVPEPSSLALLATSLLGVGALRRRHRSKKS